MQRRAIGYARVSSLAQALGTSLEDQQRRIRAHAKARGLTVAKMYVEAESAGRKKLEQRHQMRALMADLREGDAVIADKLDRWSRDPEHTYRSTREIREAGGEFLTVTEGIDGSPTGLIMLDVCIMQARQELERIRERMVGTRKILRNAGYYVEGLPPLGYARQENAAERIDRNVLVIEPQAARTARTIFRLAAAGKTLREMVLASGLEKSRIHKMVRQRVYLGELQDSEGRWRKAKHPPLIDAALFERAQVGFTARRHGRADGNATARTATWVLRDVARCLRCGRRMTAVYGNTQLYYRCFAKCTTKHVRVDVVEAAFAPMALARLESLRVELSKETESGPAVRQVTDYTKRREALARRRESYVEMRADGMLTREQLREKMAKVDAETLKLDAEEGAAKKRSPFRDTKVRRSALASLDKLRDAWARATPQQRRRIVNLMAIVVGMEAGAEPVPTWRNAEDLLVHTTG